jgi:hypothetical protein
VPGFLNASGRALLPPGFAAVVILSGCSSPLTPSAPRRGSPHYGIVTQFWSPDLGRWTADLGTGWVRLDANWFDVEPDRDVYAWSGLDAAIYGAEATGLRVYATLAYTPAWAGPCHECMPNDPGDWRGFVQAVLAHYRGAGVVFGIWNEPNLGTFLDDTPDAERYAVLFSEANAARQTADPGAILAGPETSHHGFPAYYQAAMQRITPSMRPDDVVSVHYYADAPFSLGDYMSGVGVAAGRRPVWLTETGISTCDDAGQRQFFTGVLQTYEALGRTWWANVFPYVLYNGQCDALVNPDGSYRSSFLAYRAFIAAHP